MYNISVRIFDEDSLEFKDQLESLNEFGIHYIEIDDHIDRIELINMNGEQIERYRNMLIDYNKKIVLLHSTINSFDLKKYHLLFKNAHLLKVENIKLCYNNNEPNTIKLSELEEILKMGNSYNIRCLIENNAQYFDLNALNNTKLFSIYKDYSFGLIFNPLEIVKQKAHPFFHVFYKCRYKNSIAFLRINDGLYVDGSSVKIGEGNAEIKAIISALFARNYNGYLSIESHYQSGADDNIGIVFDILKNILKII